MQCCTIILRLRLCFFPASINYSYEVKASLSLIECAGFCQISDTCQAAVYRNANQCLLITNGVENVSHWYGGNSTFLDIRMSTFNIKVRFLRYI